MDQAEIAAILAKDNPPQVSDSFGYWFAGLVDGEGNFILDIRWQTSTPGAPVRKVGLKIQVRGDDLPMLEHIHTNIGGTLKDNQGWYKLWMMQRVKDVATILVPLFDKYPLHSKKAKEFVIWREMVLRHYEMNQLRKRNPEGTAELNEAFYEARDKIRAIRDYETIFFKGGDANVFSKRHST